MNDQHRHIRAVEVGPDPVSPLGTIGLVVITAGVTGGLIGYVIHALLPIPRAIDLIKGWW